jgi:type VI secretion system protein ImpG
VVSGPSRPYAPLADGAVAWRAISHLSANYLSLVNSTAQEGAAALRDVLELYASSADVSARKQIEGIRSVQVQPVVRRLPAADAASPGGHAEGSASTLAFGRGLEISMEVDELAFEGASALMLGSVLHHYFSRYVSVNSFVETVVRSQGRGEICRWMPQWGARPTL